jgi:hypothetical protein
MSNPDNVDANKTVAFRLRISGRVTENASMDRVKK